MKKLYAFCLIFLTIISCKTDTKKQVENDTKEVSILEKIANAHGYENWNKVQQISFTFNVDRDSSHFERSWVWKPKTNDVTHISGTDSLFYNRKDMDSIALKTNGGFINDRYWLMAPFNLIWDADNFDHTHSRKELAPISKKPMQKLTIVYGNEGGYTPGDAYDFYFEDDYLIKEWVFRKANQEDPSMTTTWENYIDHNSFKFAMDHKKDGENFNLYFDKLQTIVK